MLWPSVSCRVTFMKANVTGVYECDVQEGHEKDGASFKAT